MTEPHADERREEAPHPFDEQQPPDTSHQGGHTGRSDVPGQRSSPADASAEHPEQSEHPDMPKPTKPVKPVKSEKPAEKATEQGESDAPGTSTPQRTSTPLGTSTARGTTSIPSAPERDWALAAHLGSFLAAYVALGFLCPLIVLLAKGKSSSFVRQHAIESLNFQLTALGAALVTAVLSFVYVGLILLPFLIIGYVALVVMAGLAAYRGQSYRYPVSLRMIS